LSLTFAWSPWEDLFGDSEDSLSDTSDSSEDSGNPLSDLFDSFQDDVEGAVDEALNQNSIDSDNLFDESLDSDDCRFGWTWCDILSECLTLWDDCVNDTENSDDSLEAPGLGADEDEHGCIGSAGYAWCTNLEDCLRPWELIGNWNDLCEIFSDNTSISVNNSTESFLGDENFVSTSVNDSSSSSDDGSWDIFEDSDNPLGEVLDSFTEAVEEALNQSSIDSEDLIDEDIFEDSDNPLSEFLDSVTEAFEEALNQSSIDSEDLDDIEDSDPFSEALDSVKETIEEAMNWSTTDTEDWDDMEYSDPFSEALDSVKETIEEAMNWSTVDTEDWLDTDDLIDEAQESIKEVEDLIDEALEGATDGVLDDISSEESYHFVDNGVDDSSFSSDDVYHKKKDGCKKGKSWCKGCNKNFFQSRIFIAIVILICLIVSCLCWQLRRRHLRAKRLSKINMLTINAPSMTTAGKTTAQKEAENTSGSETTTAPDSNALSTVL